MRDRISNSLFKLASVTLKFQSETKGWTTHLVQSAYYDITEDIVEIKAEPKLFELYHMDRRVLLRLKAIDALQRKGISPRRFIPTSKVFPRILHLFP